MTVTVGVVDPARTRELRRRVLRPHLAVDAPLPGDDLPAGVHVGASDLDGTVLCTCFVYPDPCPWLTTRPDAWHLRQMATLPEHRGEGLGGQVVAAAVEYVRGEGAGLIWCYARETAVGFYAARGFTPHGPIFTEEQHQIPHQRMWRELRGPATSSERAEEQEAHAG